MSVIALPIYFLFSEKLFLFFQDTLTFTNQSSDSSSIIQIGLLLEYPVHLIKGQTLLHCIFLLDLHLPIVLHLLSHYLHSCPQSIQNYTAGINLDTNPSSKDIETCISILMHFGKSCIKAFLLLLHSIYEEKKRFVDICNKMCICKFCF